MKKLLLLLLIVPFLSYGQFTKAPSPFITPCQCADMAIEALSEAFENLDMSEGEVEKMEKKWKKKMQPCDKKVEADPNFKKELEKCLLEKLQEE